MESVSTLRHGVLMAILVVCLVAVGADYSCVCNYSVERKVFPQMSVNSKELGFMYEFDCKPAGYDTQDTNWVQVQFEHKYGYAQTDTNLQIQMCQGSVPSEDKVYSTTPVHTTPVQTTTTTTVPSTTQPTTAQTTSTTPLTTASTTTLKSTTTPKTSTTTRIMSSTTLKPTTPPTTPKPTTRTTTTSTTTMTSSTTTTNKLTSPVTTTTQPTTSVPSTVKTTPTFSTTTQTTSTVTTKPTPLSTTSITPTSGSSSGGTYTCASKYFQYAQGDHGFLFTVDDRCYELAQVQHTWTEAEHDCMRKGGHLAHIPDEHHQIEIYNFVQQHHGNAGVWIGLNDRQDEKNYQWASGDPVVYTNWMQNHQSILHRIEDCVALGVNSYQGHWDDVSCYSNLHYICEFDAVISNGTLPTLITPPPSSLEGNTNLCPYRALQLAQQYHTLLVQHEDSCYELLHGGVTWDHAESLCRQAGGHLAHINNAQEQAYVQSLLTKYSPQQAVWIGLHNRNWEGHFEWTSGGIAIYTNWIPGHSNNFGGHNSEDCVALIPNMGGVWDDIPCGGVTFFGLEVGEKHQGFCEYNVAYSGSLIGR